MGTGASGFNSTTHNGGGGQQPGLTSRPIVIATGQAVKGHVVERRFASSGGSAGVVMATSVSAVPVAQTTTVYSSGLCLDRTRVF